MISFKGVFLNEPTGTTVQLISICYTVKLSRSNSVISLFSKFAVEIEEGSSLIELQ